MMMRLGATAEWGSLLDSFQVAAERAEWELREEALSAGRWEGEGGACPPVVDAPPSPITDPVRFRSGGRCWA